MLERLNPDEQIEAALRDGLSEDRSGIGDRREGGGNMSEEVSEEMCQKMCGKMGEKICVKIGKTVRR